MKEDGKSKISTYVVGGLGGAVIVLIAGFSLGMLRTNAAVSDAVNVAVADQQAQFCAERARAADTYVDGVTFAALELSARREFVAPFAAFDGQSTSAGRSVASACMALLGEA